MKQARDPHDVHPPLAAYTHQIELSGAERLLVPSGQIGARPDGSVPGDALDQLEVAWDNIEHNLQAAGMQTSDLVKLTLYLVYRPHGDGEPPSGAPDGRQPRTPDRCLAVLIDWSDPVPGPASHKYGPGDRGQSGSVGHLATKRATSATSTGSVVSTSRSGHPPATGRETSSFHSSSAVRAESKWPAWREPARVR